MTPDEPQLTDLAVESEPLAAGQSNTRVPDENSGDYKATNRLISAVTKAGGPTDVSRRSGIPIATLKSFLGGRDVRRSALVALADACGVSVEWLATGRGDPQGLWINARSPGAAELGEPPDGSVVAVGPTLPLPQVPAPGNSSRAEILNIEEGDYVAIPRYNITASAGGGALADHAQVVEYLAFSKKFLSMQLHRPSNSLALIEARGDSMEPTVRDGDILTLDIRPDQPLENGRLYVIRVDDNLLVKRIELRLTSIVLHSDNPRYAPEALSRAEAETLQMIGKVILVTAPPR